MSFEIQTTSYFDTEAKRLAKRHRSFIDDLQDFQEELLKNPYQGTELSPGIRKIRLTIDSKGRGKSGGARVITFTYLVDEKDGVVILLLLYDKADASSIKMNVVRKIIKDLGLDLEKLQSEGKLKSPNQT
jgi:mRNA-degrading endonuclease RelE of RelBE toxin-antitoxin system